MMQEHFYALSVFTMYTEKYQKMVGGNHPLLVDFADLPYRVYRQKNYIKGVTRLKCKC